MLSHTLLRSSHPCLPLPLTFAPYQMSNDGKKGGWNGGQPTHLLLSYFCKKECRSACRSSLTGFSAFASSQKHPRDPLCALCDLKKRDLLSRGTLAMLMCPHLFCFLQMKDPEELHSKGCSGFVNSAATAAAAAAAATELEFPV